MKGKHVRSTVHIYFIIFIVLLMIILFSKHRKKAFVALVLLYGINACYILAFIICLVSVIFGQKNNLTFTSKILFGGLISVKHNFDKLPAKPCIFVANYPSDVLEYFVHAIVPMKICLLVSHRAVHIVRMVRTFNSLIIVDEDINSFEITKEKVKKKISEGYSIFTYSNNVKSRRGYYRTGKLRTGMFHIGKEIGVDVIPFITDHIDSWGGMLMLQPFHIHVGSPVDFSQPDYVERTTVYMQKQLTKMLRTN